MIRLTCSDNVPAWFCDMSLPVYEDDSGIVHLNNKIPDSLKVFGFFSLALPGGGLQKFRYELEKFGWNMYELIDPSLEDMAEVESICYMWVKSDVIAMQQRDLIYDFIGIAVNRHYMEIEFQILRKDELKRGMEQELEKNGPALNGEMHRWGDG